MVSGCWMFVVIGLYADYGLRFYFLGVACLLCLCLLGCVCVCGFGC